MKEDAHFESTLLFKLFIVQVFKGSSSSWKCTIEKCAINLQLDVLMWSFCWKCICFVVRSPCSLFLCDHFVKIAASTCYVCVLVWLCCWKCITRLKCDHLLEVGSFCYKCVFNLILLIKAKVLAFQLWTFTFVILVLLLESW